MKTHYACKAVLAFLFAAPLMATGCASALTPADASDVANSSSSEASTDVQQVPRDEFAPADVAQDVVSTPADASSDAGGDAATNACTLTANTLATATVTNGCALLTRDTSSCAEARRAQGLSGAWLKFSCRVTLTNMPAGATPFVLAASDSRPDYLSNYFPANDPCYTPFVPRQMNPNRIAARQTLVRVPTTTNMTATRQGLGPIGVAVNGVAIFNNQAAPGDDIFREADTFDRCAAHPAPDSTYHYHSEPYAISSDDANLIGVLKDGYFLYGRRDMDGTMPTLDASGGHVGMTADYANPVYHYHVNEQTSTAAGTLGQRQWFLTTGTYRGVPLN